ncbi:cobalamin biosynthesis protein [Ruegeria pomeroyi]|uniref:Cobalamin biosynthesis domain protein n=2 Tax=Ruegeria pomeroyi TaxID=89184 RepID=Q5LPH8_RUEPO|nr:cobalamin biosynthesis protein [Ruegeria pomeroyi]AAV96111.1 cobalamin biosynthesis domain protein [Ruegeria pomeroyi DSS-3]NVK97310.1 cobalamin biosynthesis protein [Ruegeria pomeroyi]NVL01979.1 cobalamin biosynthesis protein [Ruegeria pomeroyi]QWV09666.1 cobalamin biosynthesis protein [Ruegeria pomeroyi]
MIVAGLGFTTTAEATSLRAAYDKAAAGQAVAALATVADKAGHPALEALAADLALPLHLIPAAELAGQRTLTCSPQSRASYGTGSVAEAAALVAAGPGARLITPRQISDDRRATCALAIGDKT